MSAARVGEQTGLAAYACGEPAALRGEFVEVRAPIEPAPVTAKVRPTQVIGHDEDHVGACLAHVRVRIPLRVQVYGERQGQPQAKEQDSSLHGLYRGRLGGPRALAIDNAPAAREVQEHVIRRVTAHVD